MDSRDVVYEALRLRQRALLQEGNMENMSELVGNIKDMSDLEDSATSTASMASAVGRHGDVIDFEQ